MPYIVSDRKELIKNVESWVALAFVTKDKLWEEEATYVYNLLSDTRYISQRVHRERDNYFFTKKFFILNDREFRSAFRTTREGLAAVATLIHNHPVFYSNSYHKQTHPGWQLAIAMYRFGHYGNACSITDIASYFGIGHGTVTLFTNRVITALNSVAFEWIQWPTANRREEISQ
ncbi:hypothetical protein BGZ76_007683, partial [Entomortierella beljakovae]